LLNINGGLELDDPNVILSVWASNVLDEQYITSAGNTGSLFGVPTFVPGPPRMVGTKLTWNFNKPEKRKSRR
jgi:outer membrane receptor protein involved in Fe transport